MWTSYRLRPLPCSLLAVLVALGGCGAPSTITPAPAPSSSVLLIGIDGATFDLIDPLIEQGRLPQMAALIERGARAPLETIEPTLSPAIWTTVATGKLPDEHGIHGFDGVPGRTMTTLPTSQMRRVRAFWNILTEHARSVGVIGWWCTWPAEPVRGYVVSDRVAYTRMEAAIRDEGRQGHEVYPEAIADEIARIVRRPEAIANDEIGRFVTLPDAEVERLVRGVEYRHGELLPELKYVFQADRSTASIATTLLQARPTDVTAVAFYGVDAMSHLAWQFMQPERFPGYEIDADEIERFGDLIPSYYAFVDELVGELVAAAPADATVIVFSDHGFGPSGYLPWSGGHGTITPGAPVGPDGILILAGPPIRRGVRLERAHVLDITPTLLYLQGLPTAADMSGRVLSGALEAGAAQPREPVATYETGPLPDAGAPLVSDPELDRELLEKLRHLGYIE